jgi:hypothetical protein
MNADQSSTSVLGASVNYRLSQHVNMFSTFSRSKALNEATIKSAQIGLRLSL